MTIDQGKFLRLTSSIRATLDSLGVDGSAAKALSDAYTTYRAEAHLIANQQDVVEEFDRMFPHHSTLSAPEPHLSAAQ